MTLWPRAVVMAREHEGVYLAYETPAYKNLGHIEYVHTYVNPEKNGLNGPPGTASVRYLRSVTGKRIGGNLTLHLVHLVVQEKAKFRTWFRRVVKRPV